MQMFVKLTAIALVLSLSGVRAQEEFPPNLEICVGQNDNHLFPYPGICEKYYACSGGIGFVQTCPEPFRFNPKKGENGGECDWPEEVPSCGGIVEGVNCTDVVGVKFLPNEKSCNEYYICFNELAFEATCADGLLFDYDLGDCFPAASVNCSYVRLCDDKKDGEFVPGFTCSQYFVCVDSEQFELNCLPGLRWDQPSGRCVEDKECTGAPKPPAPVAKPIKGALKLAPITKNRRRI